MARPIDEGGGVDSSGRFSGGHGQVDTAAIRADIRETRERMSQTLDGIGERLNPDHIRQQVKHNLREATIGRAEHMARNAAGRVTETRRGIADTIRENPIPAAMVGIGLGWLLYSGRRSDSYGQMEMGYWTGADPRAHRGPASMHDQYGTMDRAAEWTSDTTDQVRERAQELTGRAQETVTELADRSREATTQAFDRTGEVLSDTAARARTVASDVADRTRHQTRRLEDRFHDAIVESPLIVGAAAVALGLTAGLALPTTRREAELMGGTRDRLVDQAREMAEETTGRVRQVAERVMDEAQSTVREAAQDLQSTAREAAQEQGLMSSPSSTASASVQTGSSQTGSSYQTTQTGAGGSSVADPRSI